METHIRRNKKHFVMRAPARIDAVPSACQVALLRAHSHNIEIGGKAVCEKTDITFEGCWAIRE